MRSLHLKGDTRYWIVLAILFFMAIAFIIRMIPVLFVKDTGFLSTMDSDTWYTLRQVEVMVNHFPRYDWFDPMTAFPTGKVVDWGPLFPFITAAFCLVTGSTTHSAIVFASGWVSPLMAALMVPVTYFTGKTIWDRKAGIVAAGLISVVSLIYFSLTTYGLAIHHIGELLFSSLFFLVYVYYLSSGKCQAPPTKNIKALLFPVALATLAGVLYFLALITSTTTLLALIVIAIFTLVQSVADHLSGRSPDRLLFLNLVLLSVSAILLALFGFKQPGYSVTSYTIGLVYVNLALIAETVLLSGLSTLFRGKNLYYVTSIVAVAFAGLVLTWVYPPFETLSLQAQDLLFNSSNFTSGVYNTAHLTLSLAWEYFSVALILAAAGFLILGYHIIKKRKPACIFLMVWSAFMILITIQFQRFAYFSTINIVLLSAICITEPFTWKRTDGTELSIRSLFFQILPLKEKSDRDNPPDKPSRSAKVGIPGKTKKRAPETDTGTDELKSFCLGAVVILAIALAAISVYHDADLGLNNPSREISPDWIETVNWLANNTPPTGVDYFQQYDASTFSYPPGAYGILARWDAGHWITFFSHRIPITNPFQDHLGGSSGAYAFYLSENESQADDILGRLGGRYVITDSDLAVSNFPSLELWENNSNDVSRYITPFMVPSAGDPSRLLTAHAYNAAFFQTMIIRLYSFDGSMAAPGPVQYIQYDMSEVSSTGDDSGNANGYTRIITLEQSINGSQIPADTPLLSEGLNQTSGKFANVFSIMPDAPVGNIPALQHYRLVHESPDSAIVVMFPESSPATNPDMKQIKIFEYVKGAHIPGEGVIELPVTTNTGRTFVYRQESSGGEFVVPYATEGNMYGVKATGPYHITGTTRYINVTEADIEDGTTVSGSG